MITLDAGNRYVRIFGASMSTIIKLDKITCYFVAGAYLSPAFKKKRWDGKEHLLVMHSRSGCFRFPIGLLDDVCNELKRLRQPYRIKTTKRTSIENPIDYKWTKKYTPYRHQAQVIKKIIEQKHHSGILHMPIRSGKTLMASRIIYELKGKTIFLVTSLLLVYQSQQAIAEMLDVDVEDIGVIAEGVWIEKDITIASVSMLTFARGGKRICQGNKIKNSKPVEYKKENCICGRKKCNGEHEYTIPTKPEYKKLVNSYDIVFFDECFPAGTLVDGKPIEDLEIGDLVSSYDEKTLQRSFQKITHKFKNKPNSLIKINTPEQHLVCTLNHPLLTNKGWVTANEVENGMYLVRESNGFEKIRVDSVEILQPGCDGKYGGLCPDGYVYNIEVENTHTYVANGFIVHNCHHLTGNEWRKVMMDIRAPHRIGLSATAMLEDEKELERGVIWLKACCGPIRASISLSTLIEKGFLVRPEIWLYKVPVPVLHGLGWYSRLLADAVFENDFRNQLIADVTEEIINTHRMRVLIITRRLKQTAVLGRLIEAKGIPFAVLHGSSTKNRRELQINKFKNKEIMVIIGTIIKEGVNIPELEAVINAEGGSDIKATTQRMRNLTPHPGKTKAIFVDFVDMTSSYTASHSLQRIQFYRSERAFNVILKQKKVKKH